jgi:tRNA(Ile)-lysidine synthase
VSSLVPNATVLRDCPPDVRYLIGVSGGRDSVVLLHWLISLGYKNLVVCHLNHQLRGRSSDADARFVQKLVDYYNRQFEGQTLRPPARRTGRRSARPATVDAYLDFEFDSTDVQVLAKEQKMSIETAAREARYAFFAKTARRRHCRTIFLAHHADDLVETFLFNLMRGAGLTGLSTMRDTSTRRVGGIELTIVRPLLSIWRKEIENYVRERQLKFREDATNTNLVPLRNRIRHRVIPYLEKTFGRNIRRSIWRIAMITAAEEKWLDSQLPDSIHADLSVPKLRALPIALQRRAILKWLRTQNISDVGFDIIERVRSLADPDARIAKVNLPRDRHARRRAGKIFLD